MKADTKTIFRIPIKPHLKKFVLVRHRAPEPLRVTERTLLGACIIKVLQENRQHKFQKVLEQYTDRISVVLTHDMMERSPRLKRLVYVNSELDRDFKEALFVWVEAQMESGVPANEACKNFLSFYKIDESEFTYDAAYKAWQRFKVDDEWKRKQA